MGMRKDSSIDDVTVYALFLRLLISRYFGPNDRYGNVCPSSSEVDELNLEDKRGVGRDHTASASCSVSIVGWAGEDGFLTLLELSDALVPASDNLACADNKLERLTACNGGIEDCAVGELASVVDLDSRARWADWAGSFVEFFDCE